MVAGVCSGLADCYDIDVNVVRLVFVVASFFGFVGVLAYLAAWVILPEQGESASIAENMLNKKRTANRTRCRRSGWPRPAPADRGAAGAAGCAGGTRSWPASSRRPGRRSRSSRSRPAAPISCAARPATSRPAPLRGEQPAWANSTAPGRSAAGIARTNGRDGGPAGRSCPPGQHPQREHDTTAEDAASCRSAGQDRTASQLITCGRSDGLVRNATRCRPGHRAGGARPAAARR